jgi:hypothetical protein
MRYSRPSKASQRWAKFTPIRPEQWVNAQLVEPVRKSNQHSIRSDNAAFGKIRMNVEDI